MILKTAWLGLSKSRARQVMVSPLLAGLWISLPWQKREANGLGFSLFTRLGDINELRQNEQTVFHLLLRMRKDSLFRNLPLLVSTALCSFHQKH